MDYPKLGTSRESLGSIALCSVFEILAITALFLRIWSRRLKKTSMAFNDYAAFAAMVCGNFLHKKCCADEEPKILTTAFCTAIITGEIIYLGVQPFLTLE